MKCYQFHARQFGFLARSNTETAMALAARFLKNRFRFGAVLDLKSAYDMLPRDRLLAFCRTYLAPELCDMIKCLEHCLSVHTKGQNGLKVAHLTIGLPKRDPFSPWLFNVFIDSLLMKLNIKSLTRTLEFADDSLGLSFTWNALRNLLRIAKE